MIDGTSLFITIYSLQLYTQHTRLLKKIAKLSLNHGRIIAAWGLKGGKSRRMASLLGRKSKAKKTNSFHCSPLSAISLAIS